ncbi:MAG: N-6 DNA methylase [Robiginitomaculum sp.]|nr:N-6 DNA methylase [Robiginitomaculum sp.]
MNEQHIADYLAKVQSVYATGVTTEHSFRAALGFLFDGVADDVRCINEPKMVTDVGRPDFVFKRTIGKNKDSQQITVGHCEAKDIDKDINPRAMQGGNKAQFDRYVKGLPNLVYTNGLDFRFYVKGELVREVSVADFLMGIAPKPENYGALYAALKDFTRQRLQTITSAKALAQMMAGKAVLIKTVLANTLLADIDLESELAGQYKAFKDQLIHDLTIESFADIYAETIAYGLFAARLHDETPEDFSREEALDLLPKSNPFLRKLFSYVAGPNLDERLRRDVDELAEIFQAVNLQKLFEISGNENQRKDPFIHFYETFLAEYNPKKRKARGVWYTPEPVVNFIVRAVDDVLKSEFGLSDGLADTSKISVKIDTGQSDKSGKAKTEMREMHRVQILDPATGTGTFLAEVIKQIAPKIQDIAPAHWSKYVEDDLIPRLHGFELLMASYAMCHMKLDMMLTDMGYKPTKAEPPRLNVFLTNSLEEGEREVRDLFMARWLSDEAKGANEVKRDKPIMCIIGNPPYSGESGNKGKGFEWIEGLMQAYKKEPGGKEKLKERNPKWINDDYVKFIRFGEHLIEKNGEGILAYITNHGYLDNPTFRGMRWHLLKTFDKIHVLDLHGNAKKKEVAPDGSPDKNVFDIMQGVSIIVAVKTKKKSDKLAKVYHGDLWGARQDKYDALWKQQRKKASAKLLKNQKPQYPFVVRDFALEEQYNHGFSVNELMPVNSVGIVTARDSLTVDKNKNDLWQRVQDFTTLDSEVLRNKYNLGKDVRDWKVKWAIEDVQNHFNQKQLTKISYRPFDTRWTFYTGKSRGFLCYPRNEVMRHFLAGENLGLMVSKQQKASYFQHALVFENIVESSFVSNKTSEIGYGIPLYLYPDTTTEQSDAFAPTERTVNMDAKIRGKIEKAASGKKHGVPDEVQIFDYIYGVLHCPGYRDTYKEFLKIDFPRVPYPASPAGFWDISAKGTLLRKLHLMEASAIGDTPYRFEGEENKMGDSVVDKPKFTPGTNDMGTVHINKTQYFEDVPLAAWEFYIGGYQPAQKWLKDRKGRTLSFDDIRHYQKIIKILSETDRIMQSIKMDLGGGT